MDDAVDISKINSVQNGLLMDGGLNILLNQYIFSVNPDVCLYFTQRCPNFHANRVRMVIKLFLS